VKKRKIRAITPFKVTVIQGHQGRYQSKDRMRLPILPVIATDNGDNLSRTVSELSQLIFQILYIFRYWAPSSVLGTAYDVLLGLIWKRVVDFLLVLSELFSLGVTAEALRAKIDRKSATSLQRGHFDPKFLVEGVPHQSFCTDS